METEIFQHYQILRRDDGSLWELGRGAMAVTYKAIDNNLRCPVALKVVSVVNLEDEHTRARFVREARAAAALRHRNIASVYHLGNDEQSYFYAMEFIDGETVEDRVLRLGPLPPAEALGIAAQVARALGAAAKQGLVHRDIKPANVMVVRDDDEEGALIVKVIDFGLARRAVVSDQAAQITVAGFVGTPQYASPEQIAERDLDSRSDIYSLGVTLWFMLTGRPTFTGPPVRISSQHLDDEPPWTALAGLPDPVRALLAHTLQKNPADRPQDPSILRREIEACLAGLHAAGTGTATAPAAGNPAQGDTTVAPRLNAAPPPVLPSTPGQGETTFVPEADVVPQGPAPAAGEFFAERFRLLELVGEGSAGPVFRAADARHGERPVAVKVIRPDLGLASVEVHHLREELRRLRGAPHPCLIDVFVLDQARGYRFMATEWINGFTLVDLLRRRGRLELPEALRLLESASAAAAHGSANGLHRLELSPRQILLHFPGGQAGALPAIIDRPLAQWPEFGLKINAVAPAREVGRTPTWTGEMTLVPSANRPERSAGSGARGLLEGNYFYALGSLLYEMLNGTAPPHDPEAGRDVPPLSMLSEQANEVLQRALSVKPGFRDERAFFADLLAACGLEHGNPQFKPKSKAKTTSPPTAGDKTVVPSPEPALTAAAKLPAEPPAPVRMAPTIRTTLLRPRGTPPRPAIPAHAGGRPARVKRWMVAAGAFGFAAAAVGGYFLSAKRPLPPPAKHTPVELFSTTVEETTPTANSAGQTTPDGASPAAP